MQQRQQQPTDEEERQLLLKQPIKFLSCLFERNLSQNDDPIKAFELSEVKDLVESALEEDISFEKQILTISNNHVESNEILGRFRGMVQDIRDMEFYSALVEVNVSSTGLRHTFVSKYRDVLSALSSEVESESNMDSLLIEERLPITLIQLPEFVDTSLRSQGLRKRPFEEISSGEITLPSTNCVAEAPNAPICCIVKMYDSYDQIRLNDIMEVVGIYTTNHCDEAGGSLSMSLLDSDPFDDEESAMIPPCLHCITYRRIGSSFPLLLQPQQDRTFLLASRLSDRYSAWSYSGSPISLPPASNSAQLVLSPTVDHRTSLIRRIAGSLGGDELLAEYVLLTVISRVYGRADAVPVGALGLRICGVQSGSLYKDALPRLLAELGVYTQSIGADPETLNRSSLMPRRCPVSGCLSQSLLQLPSGSVLIIDETDFDEERLTVSGTQSMHTLRSVASEQLLPVMFSEFHQTKFPVDYPVISLCGAIDSEGALSIGGSGACSVKIMAISGMGSGTSRTVPVEKLGEDVSWWLSSLRSLEVGISDEVAQIASDDFVSSRQTDPRLTHGDLSIWLTVARLVAASYGRSQTSSEDWSRMRWLERLRRERDTHYTDSIEGVR